MLLDAIDFCAIYVCAKTATFERARVVAREYSGVRHATFVAFAIVSSAKIAMFQKLFGELAG